MMNPTKPKTVFEEREELRGQLLSVQNMLVAEQRHTRRLGAQLTAAEESLQRLTAENAELRGKECPYVVTNGTTSRCALAQSNILELDAARKVAEAAGKVVEGVKRWCDASGPKAEVEALVALKSDAAEYYKLQENDESENKTAAV